jgi:DNA-directed RNA polymerase delta subunit
MTTKTIASKLSVNSGPELIMATCAYLTLVLNKHNIGYQEILQEMKSASGYYKQTYTSNLGAYINNLIKGKKLVEVSNKVYSIPANIVKELEVQLA